MTHDTGEAFPPTSTTLKTEATLAQANHRLDKTKFYVVGAGIFSGLTVALYPISVVKTRLQIVTKDSVERNAFFVVRGLLKVEEATQAAIANGVAGMMHRKRCPVPDFDKSAGIKSFDYVTANTTELIQ
ncbi:hypothetical protein POM88_028694 [Heracleum sosnowskyi]|uniref:Uncharacterized protein n=1 Tax=Heracleum sosnowskyi TaxID=360622 RepID=A0AAD8HSQ2_9APIA|nr:hypothetical protein POM88_028694 [Heracleum sosnowskyi]